MSLYRQLWITVIVCMGLAFAASIAISAAGARGYLEQQLSIKNADAAKALAMSMSQLAKDGAALELQIATLFEEGQYDMVRVRDSSGRIVVEKTSRFSRGAPVIASLLPMDAAVGTAEIADGASRFGTVELSTTHDATYVHLQTLAMQLLAGFVVAAGLAGVLATWVLGRIRTSLGHFADQATAIAERRFVTIAEPLTPELRPVARAMNHMVRRLRAMFEEEAVKLEQMRHAANYDALSALARREHFLNRMAGMLDPEENGSGGLLLLVRIRDLAGLNRREGRAAADTLLQRTGSGIRRYLNDHADGLGGRLNGADFALVVPGELNPQSEARVLLDVLTTAGLESLAGSENFASIGVTPYRPGEATALVLNRADSALAEAEGSAGNGIAVVHGDAGDPVYSAQAWRRMLASAIKEQQLRLARFPVCGSDGRLLHRECYVRLDPEGKDNWLPAGRFMSHVTRADLNADFDLAVARKVLDEILQSGEAHALNLSADSLRFPRFADALLALLDQAPRALPLLWVEFTDDGAFGQLDAFARLGPALSARGCKVGIERFGRHFGHIGRLQDLGLDYIKIDASFIRGIARETGNQQFLSGVCTILHDLHCLVIADGVRTAEELAFLPKLGFDGASGPAVRC